VEGGHKAVIQQKIVDGLGFVVPEMTRRDVHLPAIPGKVLAVIGMRRCGKTTFLWQCLADRLAGGVPRETLLYFNFEDERLAGLQTTDLQWLIEIYYQLQPHLRDRKKVTLFLDEIQIVPRWETFVRRLLDTEAVELFLSGSSAKLLSREIATSMRGRAMEVLLHPFSFREFLRHRGVEPTKPQAHLTKAARSTVAHYFNDYLMLGGFPEAQQASPRDRNALLRTYVDVALLRDVIERHAVSNPTALRWLVGQLMGNAASPFSVQKFYDTLKSQGIAVAKDTVHTYLGYLEDAFMIRTVALHTASERQRMVHPRKAYPIDPGLIPIFERTSRHNLGHALETVVLLELERRGAQIGYLRTTSGYEVDFHAAFPDGSIWLLQVCADLTDTATLDREVRALHEAHAAHPNATSILLSLDTIPPRSLPASITWQSAYDWLLTAPAH
jgi:predicted AAA+ superfamily ATPase